MLLYGITPSGQEGLGKRFIYEVRSKVLFIRKNPLASEVKYDNTRCAILDIFPYMIHYNMDESNNTVIIVAVFHTSLNPKKWQIR